MRSRSLILCLSLLSAAVSFAVGQDALTRLRLAQGFEESADWERAVLQYEDLHRTDAANYIYYDGLLRSYAQLRRFDDAIRLVTERSRLFPKDALLLGTLAGLEYDAGHESRADSLWRAAIASDPANPALYRTVAAVQLERRLLDRAVATYLSARRATGNASLFADELGGLYSAMQDYAAATREFLKTLAVNPQQLGSVETRIASFTIRNEGIAGARSAVADEIAKRPGDVTLRSLNAWLAMEGKDYESAYREYAEIDRLGRANGRELFLFAQRAAAEQAWQISARAFHDVIAQSSNPGLLPTARLGYARAVEELSASDSSAAVPVPASAAAGGAAETHPTSARALQLYESIANDYQGGDAVALAWFRIGVIAFDRLFDLDRAMAAFGRARTVLPGSTIATEAAFKTAEVLLVRNDLDAAQKELEQLSASPHTMVQEQAAFRLAEVDYYRGRFDHALELLKRFTVNVGNESANDALSLQVFIAENNGSAPQGLADFAAADLLMRQRKYSEALPRFQQICSAYAGAPLADDAVIRMANLQQQLGKPADALTTLRHLVKDMPASILKDLAQFRIAEITERVMHDREQAVAAYEELLAKYPNSLYAEESRKRIRHLRNDSL